MKQPIKICTPTTITTKIITLNKVSRDKPSCVILIHMLIILNHLLCASSLFCDGKGWWPVSWSNSVRQNSFMSKFYAPIDPFAYTSSFDANSFVVSVDTSDNNSYATDTCPSFFKFSLNFISSINLSCRTFWYVCNINLHQLGFKSIW